MGTDFYGGAAIGLRVARARVYQTKREKTFDHNYPADWTHDPKTGDELWEDVEEQIDLGPYEVVGDEDEGESEFVIVALCYVKTTSSRSGMLPRVVDLPTDRAVAQFREAMIFRGLWSPAGDRNPGRNFGLWAILEYSC